MGPIDFARQRARMVDNQVAARGIRSRRVLDALCEVPREAFLPQTLHEFACEDAALLVESGLLVAQPHVLALMIEALGIEGGEKVLEIGTGSGYRTAALSHVARSVYSVESSGSLAAKASVTLARLGCRNAHVLHADAILGWADRSPHDAILVSAGGPHVPPALKQQLAIGGHLVRAMGTDPAILELVRLTRVSQDEFQVQDIADGRLAPLSGDSAAAGAGTRPMAARSNDATVAKDAAANCDSFATAGSANLEPLLQQTGNARIVMLGEATHGSAEFYRMRARISRELILRKDFSFIAIEADWPDAAREDHYVRSARYAPSERAAFSSFPVWMWRNEEVRSFVDWLRSHNRAAGKRQVAFHGPDLYSLYNSIRSVLRYLDDVDPSTARVARQRYGCLTPWQSDPASYGHAAGYQTGECEVVANLTDLLRKHHGHAGQDGERFLDAVQNARLVANAERYYRTMLYYGSRAAWNPRDSHMFETLKQLPDFPGPDSKAIVWAHSSHVGDSAATEMHLRGECNIGHLCRRHLGGAARLVGFGTHRGTVAAASSWDSPMEVKTMRPALAGSYEPLCREAGVAHFVLPLRKPAPPAPRAGLSVPRLERAIGVIYRSETARHSHYFQAVLPQQFDEYVWFDETRAVTPLDGEEIEGMPETYPFGL